MTNKMFKEMAKIEMGMYIKNNHTSLVSVAIWLGKIKHIFVK